MKKSEICGKRIECIIGIIMLIPPLLGVLCFIINLFVEDAGAFATLNNLSNNWSASYYFEFYSEKKIAIPVSAMSAAPIYLGIMALAGSYLIKNNIQYFFIKENDE